MDISFLIQISIMNPIIMILACVCSLTVQSQNIEIYSFAFKANPYPYGSPIEAGLEANVFSKKHLFSVGYYFGEDNEFWVSPPEKYKQLNLLFGGFSNSKNKKFRFQYQAGLGVFWGRFRTDQIDTENAGLLYTAHFTKDINPTIALPIKIGGRYIPFPFVSVGIDIQANINPHTSLVRPMLSIEIGKLRNN